MFVLLTSKPGEFHTLPGAAMTPIETYDLLAHDVRKAVFVIAELGRETTVDIVDETPPAVTNRVPTKFLPHFATLEAARRELATLAPPGQTRTRLVRSERPTP